MTAYILTSTVLFMFLGVIWTQNSIFNVICKLTLIVMAALGGYLIYVNKLLGT